MSEQNVHDIKQYYNVMTFVHRNNYYTYRELLLVGVLW